MTQQHLAELTVAPARAVVFEHGWQSWSPSGGCLLAAPGVERRADWAAVVESCGGLRGSGDRLRDLDDWGLETTRRLLRPVPATPFGSASDHGTAGAEPARG